MKKLFTLLIGGLLVISLFAQQNKNQVNGFDNTSYKCVRDYLDATQPDFLRPHFLIAANTLQNDQSSYSPDVIMQSLDSMVIMAQDWSKDWIIDEVEYYTYNTQGKCTEILALSPRNEGGPTFISKEVMTYDNQSRPKEFITYEAEDLLENKVEYVYSNGLLSKMILSSWDEDLNVWELSMKDELTYDDHSNAILFIAYSWSGTEYVNAYKEEISYDDQYIKEIIAFIWGAYKEGWEAYFKEEFSYDNNWNTILEMQSVADVDVWMDVDKTEMTYDGDKMTLSVHSTSYAYGEWTFEDKEGISYDENGNPTVDSTYKWQYESWELDTKDVFTFNDAYTTEELLLPFEWDYYYNHMLIEVDEYYWGFTSWGVEDFQFIMHYSEKNIDAIAEMSLGDVSVYPNPTNGVFTLKIDNEYRNTDIAIIDLNGRKIYSEMISNQASEVVKTIDLTTYGAGFYLLRITQGDKTSYKKVVVQ